MKYLNMFLTFFAAILLLSAVCLAQNSQNLNSEHWLLAQLNGSKNAETGIYLEFDEDQNRLTGNTGCNNLFGTIKVSGKSLKISGIGTTKKFCRQGKTALLEKNFLQALEQTTSYKRFGATLTLYAGKKVVLTFQSAAKVAGGGNPAPDVPSTPSTDIDQAIQLENKKWAFRLKNDDLPDGGGIAYITFNGESKSATGDSGCNAFGGEYTIDGDKFTFSQTMMTNRMCAGEGRKQVSSVFMTGLGLANRFTIVGGNLNLYREDRLLLTLKNADK